MESYLKDTKDTLRFIEEINKKVENGELDLNGVGFLIADIVGMYTNN